MSAPPPAIQTIDPDLRTPYNLNSSIGYRRELATNIGLDVSYIHNRGWGQVMTDRSQRRGFPAPPTSSGRAPLGRNPAITSDTYSANLGFIRYSGLVVDLRKRFRRGFKEE